MKQLIRLSILLGCSFFYVSAQQTTIPVAENLVVENIPDLSLDYIAQLKSYTESRSASLVAWHPVKKEMLILTRFSNSNQLHYVKMPGGDRKQITFFEEPIGGGSFEPNTGNYFLFTKDIGGNEFSQIYRFDVATNQVSLLTDGKKSQNGGINWNHQGNQIAYTSTKRNGQDRDIYLMNPVDPSTNQLIAENAGGGWGVSAWSPNDAKLLITEGLSVNETRLYELDIATGTKTRILPVTDERTTYSGIGYSANGKGIYLLTNKDSEFNRLAYYEIATKKMNYITTSIPWNVTGASLNKEGSKMVFITNENGYSKMYLLSTAKNTYTEITAIPRGLIGSIDWHNNGQSIGFGFSNYTTPSDIFEYSLKTKKITRWTESELGGMDVSTLQEPELITWKSFDGKIISGYLYKASTKFTGKRPVIISIHGGPEGQSLPNFQGRWNYMLNELGISLIFPNIRGSSGYGKTFLDADNGFKREDSVKDIGALLDWIKEQKELDADRIMVTGGSYGGYMSLAVSFHYADKIRCAIDVVGISHFNTFMKNTEAYRRDLRRVEYGDERDTAMASFFEKIAPLNHVNEIKKPLMIVQGGNDPRVPATEAIQMKDKILLNGGKVWFLMAKDEGHGFRKKNNQDFQFYATLEFIKQFLLN
jgi:dipeptidyl aminopeptidase/acylaminoacyl peptidase